MSEHSCYQPGDPWCDACRTEVWVTTDDQGVQRRLVIDYDARGITEVSREAFTDLLIYAGLRREMEADA